MTRSVVPHRLQVRGDNVTAVRERIERVLDVETKARPEGEKWAVYFDAPEDVNLDFLRPDVLPPRQMTAEQYVRYIKTGYRERDVLLPSQEAYRAATETLQAEGVISADFYRKTDAS